MNNIEIINDELKKIVNVFGLSMAGKYRSQGAIDFAKVLRVRFAQLKKDKKI